MPTKNPCNECGVSRRDLLRLGAGGLGLGLAGGLGPVPTVLAQASRRAAANLSGKILVVFEWFGGNDGLNTIVPYGDPSYYQHRPTIGIKEADVLKIDAQFGWHKSMRGMKNLYDEGKVAIVHGVGYDQPSFSHFTSMSFWHTAAPNSGNEYGWVGRTATSLDPTGARENMIVNISDSQTLAVRAEKHVPLVFIDPTKFQRGVFAQEKAVLDTLGAEDAPVGDAHRYVLEVTKSAAQASEVVRAAWSRYVDKANPDLRLLDLDKVVALIEADFPTKLYYVPLRGSLFDTHVNQAAPHDRQLQYCSDAIEGFFQEMQRIGRADDVVMYVHSEFGRRVPENTSLGTDHGTAQVNFVIGNAVKGGMYGKPPSLSELVLGDNLESTTDFRRVYATLIEDWLGADAADGAGPAVRNLADQLASRVMSVRTQWSPGPAAWQDDLSPLPQSEWNYDRAAHLLAHAGFGGTPDEIQKLAERASTARWSRSCTTSASPIPRCSRSSSRDCGTRRSSAFPGQPARGDRSRGEVRRLDGRYDETERQSPRAAGVRSLLLLAARDDARDAAPRLLVGEPDAADDAPRGAEDGAAVAWPFRNAREQGARLPQDAPADRAVRARCDGQRAGV